ncbi:hypothetical protein ACHAXA_003127 [Cyclostephanos tholiformis]|uniref:VWFA domain-containing protein n=1 Tax=Cyclostephanos tholiformis TaxID=382380 RepID=A0ABD3SSF6_9STRA
MTKTFPSLLCGATSLLFFCPSRPLVYAATPEQEKQAEDILQDTEERVKAFRDEIERVFQNRCASTTHNDCIKSNYNDCSSNFPDQECIETHEFVISACDNGYSCNALWDKTISKVSLPEVVAESDDSDIIERVAETACYTRLAEQYMVTKYKESEKYWAEYNIQPSWAYFGADNGLYRAVPAIHQAVCGSYNPTRRPWFVAASSGPKDVIILIDVSQGMSNQDKMSSTKNAAITIVETLTVHDKFTVLAFTNETKIFDEYWMTVDLANQNGVYTGLIPANKTNKEKMINAIDDLKPDGITNFTNAFEAAFDVLEYSIRNEMSSEGNIAILFMSDGRITELPNNEEEKTAETDRIIGLVNDRTQQLAAIDRKTILFTYSVGDASSLDVGKRIACDTEGIWTPVDNYGEIEGKMSSYYKLFALGLGGQESRDDIVWVEPYQFFTLGVNGTTVSVPVYDRSVTPHLFLGVAAVDVYMEALDRVLEEDATTWLTDWIKNRGKRQAKNTKLALDDCQLDALRYLGGGDEATCGECNKTSYEGVVVPAKCEYNISSLQILWDNTDLVDKNYSERACCGIAGTCTVPIPNPVPIRAIIGGVVGALAFAAVVCCTYFHVFYVPPDPSTCSVAPDDNSRDSQVPEDERAKDTGANGVELRPAAQAETQEDKQVDIYVPPRSYSRDSQVPGDQRAYLDDLSQDERVGRQGDPPEGQESNLAGVLDSIGALIKADETHTVSIRIENAVVKARLKNFKRNSSD